MTDAFPSFVSATVQLIHHPESKKGFRNIFDSRKLLISRAYLDYDRVFFEPILTRPDNLINNFYRTGKDSFTCYEDYDSISWDAVAGRLKLERHGKKNTDIRVCFRYGNTFLVKQYFTFGQRVVEPGTCHVYQTTTVPLFLYILPETRSQNNALRRNRAFRAADQFLYKHYVLEPRSKYRVPEGTRYVLVAAQKTLFSVDVVRTDQTLPFECRDCRETTKLRRQKNIYDMAPKTPALDTLDEMPPPPPPPPPPVYHVFKAIPEFSQMNRVTESSQTDDPVTADVESQTDALQQQQQQEPVLQQQVLYLAPPHFAHMYHDFRNRELGPPIPQDYVQTLDNVPEPIDLSTSPDDLFAWLEQPQTPNVINMSENIDELFKNFESFIMSFE